jgi:DNA polymerase III delta prime subunit
MSSIPWVEKYRPTVFEKIVLEKTNKVILENILKMNVFPNLLIYGPPGTGKTTTIINIIKKYQETYGTYSKGLVIHLNASDERGIDIIRNQISQFVNSKPLFTKGVKFVILDEVDYMTKSAQQALKYILHDVKPDVRFCLICNYISKIDETLQNEFVRLRFNRLPEDDIISFLSEICRNENIQTSLHVLHSIQKLFVNDIRSMINYIQMNNHNINIDIVDPSSWDGLFEIDVLGDPVAFRNYVVNMISQMKNFNKRIIIKRLISYIIRNRPEYVNNKTMLLFENIIHNCECPDDELAEYFIRTSRELFLSSALLSVPL